MGDRSFIFGTLTGCGIVFLAFVTAVQITGVGFVPVPYGMNAVCSFVPKVYHDDQ